MTKEEMTLHHINVCDYLGVKPCKIIKKWYPYKKWSACYNGTIYLNTANLPNFRSTWIASIAHETFHHLQAVKGYSYFDYSEVAMWKGKPEALYLEKLEYKKLPWEKEAFDFELEWFEYSIENKLGKNYHNSLNKSDKICQSVSL